MQQSFDTGNHKFVVISFPKCGRTWLSYIIRQMQMQDDSFPGVYLTHDVMNDKYQDQLAFSMIPVVWNSMDIAVQRYNYLKHARAVLLVRDPRDVVISYYYQKKFREPWMKDIGRIKQCVDINCKVDDFVYHEIFGLRTVIEFYNLWSDHLTRKDFKLVAYEDMVQNTYKTVKQIFRYWRIGYKKKHLKEAVRLSSWGKMRELENSLVKDSRGVSSHTLKMRKGIIGGYKTELEKSTIAWMDEVINNTLNKRFCKYYG